MPLYGLSAYQSIHLRSLAYKTLACMKSRDVVYRVTRPWVTYVKSANTGKLAHGNKNDRMILDIAILHCSRELSFSMNLTLE